MSRLWNRPRWCIYLGANEIAVCQVGGRRSPRVLAREVLPLADGALESIVNALTGWLAAHPDRLRIEWVLGIGHVRYLLMPWHAACAEPAVRDAVAAAMMKQRDQEDASLYQARYGPQGFRRPQLAAFVRHDLLKMIDMLTRHHARGRPVVTPLLSAVWNRYLSALRREHGNLLLVEGGRLLRIGNDRGWISDIAIAPAPNWAGMTGRDPGDGTSPVRVFAPEREAQAQAGALSGQWEGLPSLQLLSPGDPPALAFALCGV